MSGILSAKYRNEPKRTVSYQCIVSYRVFILDVSIIYFYLLLSLIHSSVISFLSIIALYTTKKNMIVGFDKRLKVQQSSHSPEAYSNPPPTHMHMWSIIVIWSLQKVYLYYCWDLRPSALLMSLLSENNLLLFSLYLVTCVTLCACTVRLLNIPCYL